MTANQRRPGFRLPWSSEEDGTMIEGEPTASAQDVAAPDAAPEAAAPADAPKPEAVASPAADAAPEPTKAAATAPAQPAAAAPAEPAPAAAADEAASPEAGDEFMRDLVAAMRAVADEARQAGVAELKTKADEQVQTLEAEAERRRVDLHRAADADIAGVGEWAAAEADRIKREAEQKVVARRARLDQELAADAGRTETESKAVRDRVAAYERELDAYHAQLSQINDPAAFAAAAKRLPKSPALGGSAAAASADPTEPATAEEPVPAAEAATNGVSVAADTTDAEVLASRLAELDASLPGADAAAEPAEATPAAATDGAEAATATEPAPEPVARAVEKAAPAEPKAAEPKAAEPKAAEPKAAEVAAAAAPAHAEPAVTEVVVKGLGSFGAITGFRQALSGVDGIESVALSLGQTGEFVFRATHPPGFDVKAAITALEGDGATIEARPEGGLRVTLERAR